LLQTCTLSALIERVTYFLDRTHQRPFQKTQISRIFGRKTEYGFSQYPLNVAYPDLSYKGQADQLQGDSNKAGSGKEVPAGERIWTHPS
jgi:hypothetical protein